MKKALIIVFLLPFLTVNGQFTDRGRHYVDTLCSSYFWGRGYTNEGCNRAAYYIAERFQQLKLKPLGERYFQEFSTDVNTFPFECSFNLNGKELQAAVDFQPYSSSGSGKGSYKVLYADSLDGSVPNSKERSVVFIRKSLLNKLGSASGQYIDSLAHYYPLVLEAGSGLTWTVSDYQLPNPVWELKSEYFVDAERVRFKLAASLEKSYYLKNVLAIVPGAQVPDSFLVLTAHYDHLGGMGEKLYIPGANDNASGTAMLLSLAEYIQLHPLKYSVVFIAFAGEEAGLLGSYHFVKNPLIPLPAIKFLFNLDLMGTGAEGATVVNATLFPQIFKNLLSVNEKGKYLVKINERGEAANSDHYFFTKAGVPAFFMYLQDANYKAYHNIYDRPSDLPLTRFSATCQLILDFYSQF